MESPSLEYKTLQQVLKEAEEVRRKSVEIEDKLKSIVRQTGLKKTDIIEYARDGSNTVNVRIPRLEAKDREKTIVIEKRRKSKVRPKTEGQSKLPRLSSTSSVKPNPRSRPVQKTRVSDASKKSLKKASEASGAIPKAKRTSSAYEAKKPKTVKRTSNASKRKSGDGTKRKSADASKRKSADPKPKEDEVVDSSRPNTADMRLRESKELLRSIGRRDTPGQDLNKYMENMRISVKN